MEAIRFGALPDGTAVTQYTIGNDTLSISVLDLGGIIRGVYKDGKDFVAGFDTVEDYLADDSYQGALIGRYANRIEDGRFTLDGVTYQLAKNEKGITHLHGGNCGFSRRMWKVVSVTDDTLSLSLFSPDMDEGYPGNLEVTVTYRVVGNAFSIDYRAVCDKNTPLNLTNHAYFNPNGYDGGDILSVMATLNADRYDEVDDALIPVRDVSVEGTVFDFREPHAIGERIGGDFVGYDHNFYLIGDRAASVCGVTLPFAARLEGVHTITAYTDLPCVQMYIGNFLVGSPDLKGGVPKRRHHTVCLETQLAPNGPNRGIGILKAGEKFHSVTAYVID